CCVRDMWPQQTITSLLQASRSTLRDAEQLRLHWLGRITFQVQHSYRSTFSPLVLLSSYRTPGWLLRTVSPATPAVSFRVLLVGETIPLRLRPAAARSSW